MCDLTNDPNRSHVIIMSNGQTVTCYDHSDDSVIELTQRYYEGKYNFNCSIINKAGEEIYKTR